MTRALRSGPVLINRGNPCELYMCLKLLLLFFFSFLIWQNLMVCLSTLNSCSFYVCRELNRKVHLGKVHKFSAELVSWHSAQDGAHQGHAGRSRGVPLLSDVFGFSVAMTADPEAVGFSGPSQRWGAGVWEGLGCRWRSVSSLTGVPSSSLRMVETATSP